MLDFQTQILPYLRVNDDGLPLDKSLYHAGYDAAKKIEEEIEEVFCEKYPKFLDKNRPKEKAAHKIYRREIYRNVVGQFRTKVLSMVNTIQQNDDFTIVFADDMPELKDYTENELFANSTLCEWFFSEWAKVFIEDPNAVVAPTISEFAETDKEYQSPKLMIVESEGVIQYTSDFAVLRGNEKTWIMVDDKKAKVGRNLYFYDKDSFVICKQKSKVKTKSNETTNYEWDIIGKQIIYSELREVTEVIPIPHNCRKVPVMKVGRILGEKIDGEVDVFRSEVSDAIPFLKGILQRASDKEIELLMHIHSVEWYYTTKKQCNAPGCKNGYVDIPNPEGGNLAPIKKKCDKCDNQGFPVNGIEYIVITAPEKGGIDGANGQQSIPTSAPGGFLPRNIETVREIRAEIFDEWEKAWATINAQWLMKSPNSTSGISKDYDRQEYTKRIAEISLHVKKHLTNEYRWLGAMRYIKSEYEKYLPVVNVPIDNFNLFTQQEALTEYTTAIDKGVSGVLTNRLAIIYADKKFGANSETSKYLKLYSMIDPFVSITGVNREQRLMLNLFNQIKVFGKGSEKLKDLIRNTYLSLNLDAILTQLVNTKSGFLSMTFEAQKNMIEQELEKYIPDTISDDVFKTIKQEPLTDVTNQGALN